MKSARPRAPTSAIQGRRGGSRSDRLGTNRRLGTLPVDRARHETDRRIGVVEQLPGLAEVLRRLAYRAGLYQLVDSVRRLIQLGQRESER